MWSRRQAQPKYLLIWNRQFTDDTTTRHRDRELGVEALAVRPGSAVSTYDRTREQERTTGGKHAIIDAEADSRFETGFVAAFGRISAAARHWMTSDRIAEALAPDTVRRFY